MSRWLRLVIPALLLPAAAAAYVDILSSEGRVYVSWTESERSHVRVYGTGIERVFQTFTSTFVSIGEVGPDFEYLAVAFDDGYDSLAVLDPLTLETVMARRLAMGDIMPGIEGRGNPRMQLATNDVPDSGIWMTSTILASYPSASYSVSNRFVPDPVQGLVMDSWYYLGEVWEEGVIGIGMQSEPLRCTLQDPPTQFFAATHSITPWLPYTHEFYSYLHEAGSEAGFPDWTMLVSCVSPLHPVIHAAGSCRDAILLLWSDNYVSEYTQCMLFDGTSSEPVQLWETDIPVESGSYWEMSGNPDDPGLLLVRPENGALWVRHYQGEWNPFPVRVAEGLGPLGMDDLAVCSDDEGYWIAWLEEGETEPEVLFVPRESVTGIPSADPQGEGPLSVSAASNPLRGIPVLEIGGSAPADLAVYDLSLIHI